MYEYTTVCFWARCWGEIGVVGDLEGMSHAANGLCG